MRTTKMLARLVLALAVLALPALAMPATWTLVPALNSGSCSQNLTGTAPSSATEGFGIGQRKWCSITVCAQAAATLTAGSIQAYEYAPNVALWTRWAAGDITLTGGVRCSTHKLPQLQPISGRIELVPNGVTVSAGTAVTLYFRCSGSGSLW